MYAKYVEEDSGGTVNKEDTKNTVVQKNEATACARMAVLSDDFDNISYEDFIMEYELSNDKKGEQEEKKPAAEKKGKRKKMNEKMR